MIVNAIANLGQGVRSWLDKLGYATRMFFSMLGASFGLLRRPRLITDQIHFIGNYSLVIIAVSGLFRRLCAWACKAITRSINTVPGTERWACWWPCR